MLDKIYFNYHEAASQRNVKTKDYVRYRCFIMNRDNHCIVPFECNPKYAEPTLHNVLYSMLIDEDCAKLSYEEFLQVFSIANSLESREMYQNCEKNSQLLHKLFTNDEIDNLRMEVEVRL